LGKVAELEVEVAAAGPVGKQQVGLGQIELEGTLEQTQVAPSLYRGEGHVFGVYSDSVGCGLLKREPRLIKVSNQPAVVND
jgi:hypothetical protein